MIDRRIFTQFDYLLFGAVLVLAMLGAIGVYSATSHDGGSGLYLRQLLWIAVGIGLCFVVASFDYHFLTENALFLYIGAILLLIGILIFGKEVNGNRSWIGYGGFGFQPSEMIKIVVILAVTRYLCELNQNFLGRRHVLAVSAIAGLPMMLVILQGDLGTAAMYFPMVVAMLLVAGIRLRILLVLLLAGALLAPAGWMALKDYQKQRILVTLDPGLDPQGYGYQVRQSQIAIGSGGITGRGLGNGMQSQLGFVPEIHTDFIFALLAEETGLIGGILILALYLFVLWRLISIAERARDRQGILIITGISALIFVHVAVNVGMALGLVPPIGIPLPLLSYGGSATLTIFLALGLALNVYYRRFVYS